MGFRAWNIGAAAWLAVCGAVAQDVTPFVEQEKLVRAGKSVTAYGPDLFGDRVNLYTGKLAFSQTDVSIPGNNALPVAVTRRFAAGDGGLAKAWFGDWDLDIPSISGIFATGTKNNGWAINNLTPFADTYKRCTYFREADEAFPNKGLSVWAGYEYWFGTTLNAPGGGEILTRHPSNTSKPADGNNWPLVTATGWQIRCLPSLASANIGATIYTQGEGFLALAPDGTQYRFDWMVVRDVPSMVKWRNGSLDRLFRAEFLVFPTEVTDRYGNWLRYNFNTATALRHQLQSISSSDGRTINFTYDGANRITSASDGTRTWTYVYAGAAGNLSAVIQPDGSQWGFDLQHLRQTPQVEGNAACNGTATVYEQPTSGTITHPSGATGTFATKTVMHGRKVSTTCSNDNWTFRPKNFAVRSITSKTLSGPGMATATWTYQYSSAAGSEPSCTTCPNSKAVEATDPRGVRTRHVYGIRSLIDDGQLQQIDEGWNGSSALRTITFAYADKSSGAGRNYPSPVGYSPNPRSDALSILYHTPQSQRTIRVQDTNFTWSASGFDEFARPTGIVRTSGLGYSRSEAIEYSDHWGKWVLGQVKKVTVPGYHPVEEHVYNPNTANREASYSFGRLLHSSGYNADGTLAWRADPAGRATSYSQHHRGLARLITYPDSATESAIVDNRGLVTAHTNSAGTTTNYGYDTIGRLASITHAADSPGWHPTTIAFERVAGAEYGIAGGHWRQTIATGNARTIRYFDALWRERLSRTHDAANEAGTRSVVERRYDADGRVTFEGYEQRDIASVDGAVAGISNLFDGLGRISQSVQSSELGNLVITTEYLAGFQNRVTNPRGHATTQGFQVFDNPAEAHLAWVSAPAGVSVNFTRDVFGKASTITRSGGGVSATRSYVYDAHQRLCKTIEPESGATVQDYDGAGNLAWRASGNALPSTSACDQASVGTARKVSYGYDTRNRLTSTSFGDGSPGIGRNYYADSLPWQVWSNGTTWTYHYNNRRLLSAETLNYAGVDYAFGHGYESHGHRSSLNHSASMGGALVAYSPNALGQPTQAGPWATNASYHPDGSLAGFRLANGSWFSMSQNTRGLPANWRYTGVLNDTYAYDANGNVASITDTQEGGATSRSMGYDALDRLTAANGPWGAGRYTYDSLDNIRTSAVGARSLTHNYDAITNRLASLTGSQSIGFAYDANGNVTQRGGQLFGFDIGNRLASAAGKASYVYDGHGRRVRTNPVSGAAVTYAYTSDGLPRWDSASGSRIYLGNRLVAELGGGGYFHTDALGSVVARSDGAGNAFVRTRYEPYGATAAGNAPARIGFTGHVNDADTGLVQMQQRHYDPVAGRFLSVDPVTTDASTGGNFNRYAYANNNPYRYTDPTGELPEVVEKLNEMVTGPYGRLSDQSFSQGNYLAGAGYTLAGAAFGVGNALTLGQGAATVKFGTTATVKLGEAAAAKGVHKNSLSYVGETHVYRIKGPDGTTHKIGESARGLNAEGASLRAEQQARRLTRENGEVYTTEIRKTFPDKASAREYETRVIERFRSMYGEDKLPGNLTNR